MDHQIRELERQSATGDMSATETLVALLKRADAPMTIEIDGETVTVIEVCPREHGCIEVDVNMAGGEERLYHLFESNEAAGYAARQYWADMAENDPEEIGAMLGNDCLIAWALGRPYAPGSRMVSSLDEWLDLWTEFPEEQWAGYDHTEVDAERPSAHLHDLIGFDPTVAYRVN